MKKRFEVIRGDRLWHIIDHDRGGMRVSQWMTREPAEKMAGILNRREAAKGECQGEAQEETQAGAVASETG